MKGKFQSKYTDKEVSPAQYLVEFICERIASKEGKSLFVRFWNDKYWNKIFRWQIKSANELLKDYTPKQILSALKTKQGGKIYSLGAKKIINSIIEQQQKIVDIPVQSAIIEQYDTNPRTPITKKRPNLDG